MNIKRFLEWFGLKEKLDNRGHQPPLVSVRDIWWANLGENIGSEINGKGTKFSRPVLILKKLSHGFYLVAPTSTKQHEGSWYVHTTLQGIDEYVCLHQIRTIDYRRVDKKLGRLEPDDFENVSRQFKNLYF